MVTSKPAASSTSAAAFAVAGRKWLLKVSTQRRTELSSCARRDGRGRPSLHRCSHHWLNVCGSNGGVRLVACDAKARTHDSAFIAPALAHSNTPQRGGCQAAVVIGKFEMRLRLPRIVARSEAEIFVEAIRIDQLARVHLPIGVPERLKFAKGLHNFRLKHFWQKFGAGLARSC